MATQTKKEEMLRWYQEHRNENWPGNVAYMDYIFKTLTKPQPPATGKRVVKYFDDAPSYLCEGEWVPFPHSGHLYYDVVENTTAYKEAATVVEEEIKKNLGELYGEFGSCHATWHQRKQLLLEKYGRVESKCNLRLKIIVRQFEVIDKPGGRNYSRWAFQFSQIWKND